MPFDVAQLTAEVRVEQKAKAIGTLHFPSVGGLVDLAGKAGMAAFGVTQLAEAGAGLAKALADLAEILVAARTFCEEERLDFARECSFSQIQATAARVKLAPGRLGEQQRQVVAPLWDDWSPAEDQAVWVLEGAYHLPDDAFDHEEPDLHFRISR